MGQDPKLGALRISLGPDTTGEDIDRAIAAFEKIAARLKRTGEAA
jgi:cysteine desulfurase